MKFDLSKLLLGQSLVFFRNLGLILLALFQMACGKAHEPTLDIHPEFTPYVTRFEQSAASQGMRLEINDLSIQFGQLSHPRENGVCQIVEGETPSVTIRKEIWDQMQDEDREELIFHELGHCVLRRTHDKNVNSYGIPQSIMNPYRISGQLYQAFRDYYLAELFRSK